MAPAQIYFGFVVIPVGLHMLMPGIMPPTQNCIFLFDWAK